MNIEQAKQLLQANDYRVLSRLQPRDEFNPDDGSAKIPLMVVDTETTGIDYTKDKIFEIGYVIVEASPETGKLYRVLDRGNELEDPGFPLPPEIVAITGVTDEDLKGKVFDRARITAAIARVSEGGGIVLAHNSGFDRKFLEAEFPAFCSLPWVCSVNNAPWEEMQTGSKKLDYLGYKVGGFFFDAHRAQTDAEAVVELVNCAGPQGKPILKHIIDRGNQPVYTVWANNSPFETKDTLKAAGYRWSDGTEPDRPKAWYKAGVVDADAELDFLAREIYPRKANINIDLVLPQDAFSVRYTERQVFEVVPVKKAALRP